MKRAFIYIGTRKIQLVVPVLDNYSYGVCYGEGMSCPDVGAAFKKIEKKLDGMRVDKTIISTNETLTRPKLEV